LAQTPRGAPAAQHGTDIVVRVSGGSGGLHVVVS
jgi:hypothetical protein